MAADERQRTFRARLAAAGLLDSPESLARQGIRPGADTGPAVLSSAQRRMWYHQQFAEDSTAYTFCLVLHLDGGLDERTFVGALSKVTQRHAIFRTTYHTDGGGEPYQRIEPDLAPLVSATDISGVPEPALPERIDDLARRAQHEPFDLTRDSSLRALLVYRSGALLAAVLTLPHIAGDGGSFRTLLADLEHFCAGGDRPPSGVRYLDYARWEAGYLGSPDDPDSRHARQLDFWTKELADLPVELALPADRPRPDTPAFDGAQHRIVLPGGLADAVRDLAEQHQASLLVLLQAAVSAALSLRGCGPVIPLGAPVDLRTDSDLADVVGFFTNTVVLRTSLDGDPTFSGLLERAQAATLAALEHREVPFEQVVERLNPPRSIARNPLFQVMIAVTSAWPDLHLGPARVRAAEPRQTQAKFDLTFAFNDYGDGETLGISVLYAVELFDSATAQQLLETVVGVLGQVAFHPGLRLSELAVFTRHELTDRARELARTIAAGHEGAAGTRTIRLAPRTDIDRIAGALYRILATHDALRLRPDLTPASAAELLPRSVLSPEGPFAARLSGAGGPHPVLDLTGPAAWLDEESWIAVLAELTGAGAEVAGSYAEYLDHTAGLAEDIGMVEHAEAWLDLLDRLPGRPPAEARAGTWETATVAVPEPVRGLGAGALRTAALAAANGAFQFVAGSSGGGVLAEVDEPDRRGREWSAGRFRRAFPVVLPEVSTLDTETLLAAVREATGEIDDVRATAYGLARSLSPHTVGALDDVPEPDFRFVLTVTDPGHGPDRAPQAARGCSLHARFEVGDGAPVVALEAYGPQAGPLLDRWVAAIPACLDAVLAEAAAPQADLVTLPPATLRELEHRFGPLADVLPLSPLQEGLLFHLLSADGDGDVYISQTTLTLDGPVDPRRLRDAVAAAVRLCPNVAAGFAEQDSQLLQVVPERVDPPWRHQDVSGEPDPEAAAHRFADDEYHAPFDPARPPMFRFGLVTLAPEAHWLLFTAHHILVDGWSIRLLLLLVLRLYTDPAAVQAPRPFRDFLSWLGEQDVAAAESAWQAVLADAPPTLLAREARAAATVEVTAERTRVLPPGLAAQVAEFARATGSTISSVLELAWATLLMRMTGSSDVVFGVVVSGRSPEIEDIDSMVGLLFNTVPARVSVRPCESVGDALAALHRQKSVHLRYSYPSLSRPQQLAGRPALFDTLFVVQNLPGPRADERFGPETDVRMVTAEIRDATHYPLSMAVTPDDHSVGLRLMYRTDVFDDTAADTLFDRYLRVLERMTEDERRPLHRIDPLADADRERLLVEYNDTAAELPEDSVSRLFGRQALSTPDDTAIVAGEVVLSFGELNAAANRMARLLLARGAGPEHKVALLLPRTEIMVEALFGVFAAHAAYVPIDEETPGGRMRSMLDRSAPTVILTTSALAALLPGEYATDPRVVCLDDERIRTQLAAFPATAPDIDAPLGLEHLAYVIFTSGSTGEPKGVEVAYRGLTNMYRNHQQAIFAPVLAAQQGRRLRIAHTTSFSFDASWEQLLWLLAGHEVHVIDNEMRRDPERLLSYFDEHRIDAFDVTPTYGQYLVDHGLLERPRPRGAAGTGVVFVSLGGEAVGDALWTSLRDAPGSGGYNLYGPTEYTINALGADVADSPVPCVGKPILNTRAYVLDAGLLPAPTGAPGELYLAGVGLARGYAGRAGLTAERFVPDPFGGLGERMYRTGDLARWRPDGSIDFLGRSDDQLKIRGYRVEPAEIENALVAQEAIAQAAVIGIKAEAGTRLAGYVVAAGPVDLDAVRDRLTTTLPSYMVPSVLIQVARLPLTVSGKLDVATLPEPVAAGPDKVDPPRSPAERSICDAFEELLDHPIGRGDDFFASGGHSLLVVRLVGKLREVLDTDISVRAVYDAPTPALLAASLATPAASTPGNAEMLVADARLDAEIGIDGLRPAFGGPYTQPHTALLTGASGFLGSFLLAEILDQTAATVFCLVRARDDEEAGRRVRESMAGYGLWEERFAERIRGVPGDLSAPRLGLSESWYARLADEVQVIFHNGAKVNDIESYERLAATNVVAARELLRLATTTSVKTVHFVSTASVLVSEGDNPPVLYENRLLPPEEVPANGYVGSKWVAEALFRAAAARGVPTAIYRPGRISGHSATGACATGIGFWFFIRAMIQLGAAPELTADQITLAPVDYVAGGIIRLACRVRPEGQAFHLVNGQPTTVGAILDAIRACGHALPVIPFEDWRRRLDELAAERTGRGDYSLAQAVLLGEHYGKYAGDRIESTVDQTNTVAALDGTGFRCPPITDDVLVRYVRHFRDVGFFPAPGQEPR